MLDANMEDYLRLSLHYAASMPATNPFEAARAATTFANKYQNARDSLEQTDADRAFWLVVRATELVDYRLPFSEDSEASSLVAQAHNLLTEAVELDQECWDAQRMLSAARQNGPIDYAHYLAEHAEEVKASCTARADAIATQGFGTSVSAGISATSAASNPNHIGANQSKIALDSEMLEMARQLTMRPYLRWLAVQASIALICGRYTLSITYAKAALELDPADPADVSFTMALAYAKLEDAEALAELDRTHPQEHGAAWFGLARMAIAFKQGNMAAADEELKALLETYPTGALALSIQNDIPDGIFGRILVEPGSEDELILAISEATVILQEGFDIYERGSMGSWLASHPLVKGALGQ